MSDNAKSGAPTPSLLQPEHALLRKDVGTWDAVLEVNMGGPTQVTTGVMVARLICGGLWLVTEFKNETGFEGHGVFGFDPAKGKYTGLWVDPMRTGLAPMEGSWDPVTKTMTMTAGLVLPDGRTIRWRETTETVNEDTQVWRSLMPAPDGGEVEVMKTTYRRRRP
jgi:Protein of unknown function (DUF1579)